MVDWKFCIDSPQQRALRLCKGSLDRGGGKGVGRYGYVDGGGESDGSEQGYGNGIGGGYGFGEDYGYGYGCGRDNVGASQDPRGDGDGASNTAW